MGSNNTLIVFGYSGIGDILLASPVLRALKQHDPEVNFTLLARKVNAVSEALNIIPGHNNIVLYDKNGSHKDVINFIKFCASLRKFRFKQAFVLHHSPRNAIISLLAGAKERFGLDYGINKIFLTKSVSPNERQNIVHYYADVLKAANVSINNFSPWILKQHEKRLSKRIVFAIGSSWERKDWPIEKFSSLANCMLNDGFEVILVGGAREVERASIIASRANVINMVGKTNNLLDLCKLIESAQLLICPDTAALHIARGVNTPSVSLFGPTSPAIYGPLPEEKCHHTIFKNFPCTNCIDKACIFNACMDNISVDEVYQLAKEVISNLKNQ